MTARYEILGRAGVSLSHEYLGASTAQAAVAWRPLVFHGSFKTVLYFWEELHWNFDWRCIVSTD